MIFQTTNDRIPINSIHCSHYKYCLVYSFYSPLIINITYLRIAVTYIYCQMSQLQVLICQLFHMSIVPHISSFNGYNYFNMNLYLRQYSMCSIGDTYSFIYNLFF